MNTPQANVEVRPVSIVRQGAVAPTVRTPATGDSRCSACHLRGMCLPAGMPDADVGLLEGLKFARRRIKEGETLFHAGQEFGFVYAVRSGTLKSVVTMKDGREQVTGFAMAGELLGLDGLAASAHATGAIALEDAEVCAIPYAHLAHLGTNSPRMQLAFSRLMSGEIVREHHLMMMLGSMNAEERLAAFLLNISRRMKARGWAASEFHLRMSRADIGSYLGMKLETVSRTFSAFQRQRVLTVDKKHIRILDLESLAAICAQTVH